MLVRTKTLIFCYGEDGFEKTVVKLSEQWSVGIEVVSTEPKDASGFPTVRLYGDKDKVKDCLLFNWDDGSSTREMEVFSEMMMGNEYAEKIWNGNVAPVEMYDWWNTPENAKPAYAPPF